MKCMKEKDVIEMLNVGHYNFEAMDNKFSRYDAFDPELGIMLEIKCRNKHYDDTMLEKMKYDWNKEFAAENGFEFFYAVTMPTDGGHHLYLFDPINMETEDNYDFKWHTKKLPEKTTFSGSKWIDKEVGYLHIDDASMVLEKKNGH